MRSLNEIIHSSLALPSSLASVRLSQEVHRFFDGYSILETEDYDFDLYSFVSGGNAFAYPDDRLHPTKKASWFDENTPVRMQMQTGLLRVNWKEQELLVLAVKYGDDTPRYLIIAKDERLAHDFFVAVCSQGQSARARILIYGNGCFAVEEKLFEVIRSFSRDELVYSDELTAMIEENIFGFFRSKELYAKYRLPWKRGVLLTGPPGNGKTQTIKAIIGETGLPCIYVRNFKSERSSVARGIAAVFQRARQIAPCLVVMEDLDSLVPRENLSNLLNELDGLASNEGVLVLATTNHPEKLDSALTERPSRFDRKIHFDLPDEKLRYEFLRRRNEQHPEEMRATEKELKEITRLTQGFTFAYLKELDLSATMMFSTQPDALRFGDCLLKMVAPLRSQIKTDAEIPQPPSDDDEY